MQSVKSDLQSIFHQYDDVQELSDEEVVGSFDINVRGSTKQSVISELQSIFHQCDDIQELFFQGDVSSFDINARDSHGKTLLHHACEYGLTEGVSILLANNAQADICDEKGYAALHYACQNNHIHYDICKILIEWDPYLTLEVTQGGSGSRSTVNFQDRFNRTILHYACIHGDFDIVDYLLKAGADPCAQDKLGNNPMHYACENGHLQCVQQLIANSQNPNGLLQIHNNYGVTPLSIKTHHGGTILHMACENGDVYVVAKLLEAGADTNFSDVSGSTPLSVRTGSGGTILHAACEKGEIDLVKRLLEAGADPNVTDEFGFTPLMRAVVSTSKSGITTDVVSSIITALCNSKCSVNALFVPSKPSDSNVHYYEGSTALHMVIDGWADNQLCIQALADNGATLDARDVHARTPLHLACEKGNINLVKKLLEAGADPNVTDEFGFTPLMRAVLSTSKSGITTDVVSFIITTLCNSKCSVNAAFVPSKPSDPNVYYCEGSTALHMAIDEWRVDPLCVQVLVDNGAALDARDVHGRTPLHITSIRGHHHLIKLLTPPESFDEDNDGCTPLYHACKNSHLECVRRFLVQAPDVISDLMKVANDGTTPLSVRTGSGGTVLHAACEKGYINLVKKLLEAGADPNATDKFGFTPLMRVVVSTSKSGIPTEVVSSIITALFNSKCNVNAPFVPSKPSDSNVLYCEGSTALHMATDKLKASWLYVQALVDNGAALDARDVHGRTPLHIASLRGHHRLIKLLAPSPESFYFKDNDGCTPLYYACKYSHFECIRACFSQCPDVTIDLMKVGNNDGTTPLSVRTGNGGTILHVACEKGDINLVKKLLEAGAACMIGYQYYIGSLDPNQISFLSIKDNNGCIPLYYACKNSHFECIQAFFDQCPDIMGDLMKIANNDGTTPLSVRTGSGGTILHVACEIGDIDLVKTLLEAGADPNVTDMFGFTPLMRAVVSTSKSGITTDVVSSIITALCNSKCKVNASFVPSKPSDSNVHYYEGSTALHMAIDEWTDNQLCVRALVDNGAALDARDVHGRTPLHFACLVGYQYLIGSLDTEQIYVLSIKDNNGCTPLYYACKNSHLECVREFMVQIPDVICDVMKVDNKCGATPLSVRGDNDQTILHVACEKGDLSIVKKVLEAGADPNSRDGRTFTPLMLAVQHVDDVEAADIVGILCEFKCNLNIQTSHFSRSLTALHIACELGKEKCGKMLIAKGANLLVQSKDGLTPLHLVCKGGYHTFTSALINEETLRACDSIRSWTPLHYACQYHHIECVKQIVVGFSRLLLLIHKTYPGYILPFYSLTDQHGRTILHHAFLGNDVQFVENLLDLGADPNVQDNDGATPLMSALKCHGSGIDVNLLSLVLSLDWRPGITDNSGRTVLHYSAKCNDIWIPLMLISAGCDVTAVDNHGQTFSDLISKESLQLINKQLLRIDRRQIICVVGYPKCGKTTIIAAFQQAQQNLGVFQRFTARLKFNTKVPLDNNRTAGIDTKVITTKRLGSLIFFDFAGQSEYYASHLAFLESALSAKGSTITFIMMVDLRCSEEDRITQCKEWLFPIKSILNDHNMLNVILIGSHLDQVGSVSTSTSSLQDTLRELKRTLGTPQMQFIDCWGMDCRQLSSKGMTNLQNYLQSTRPVHSTSAEASQVPLGACLLFDILKKSENPPLAITPSKIIDNLKDGRPPFPMTVKYIDSCCQELAASGLVLYIPNREDTGESWLILEMEEILSSIHGKLFAPDSAEFPMHHKNLANQFGLVHVEELTLAFKDSLLDPELVRKLLMAMEFCHPVDSSLMTEEILTVLFSKVSANVDFDKRQSCSISTPTEKLLISNLCPNLLFFPSLVKANEESVVLSTESDIPGDDCHRVCWELSTVKPHFLHPRFQQAVFIRLACNHVQKHKSDLSTVGEHSCTVSKNAMSWSTIHGVDVCIEIMHKSTIKVLARSRSGVKVSSLMEMFSSVVSDVLTVRANHAPGVDAYSVFRVMEKGTPGEHTVPVSSIINVVQAGGMYVNSRERPPKLVSLKDLFLDWEISVTLLEKMISISKINLEPQATTDVVSADTHSEPVMIDRQYHECELHFH